MFSNIYLIYTLCLPFRYLCTLIYVVEHFSVELVISVTNIIYMKIFYYKIEKETELGTKLARLLGDMNEAEAEADATADLYGAKEYYMDTVQDAGGIVAVEFPDNVIPDPRLWANFQIADNPKCYVPNVRIREELMEAEKALQKVGVANKTVSKQDMPFEQVQFKFSREEAAKMAGVTLTTVPLERLGKRHKIDRRKLNMLSMGVPVETILPELPDDIKTDIRLSLMEDKQIQDAMKGRKFRLVHTYEGHKKAVEIYQRWMNLPVVPFGTVNALLGVECDTHRCGLLDEGGYIYVTSAVEINNPALSVVTPEEYEVVTAELKAKARAVENLSNPEIPN